MAVWATALSDDNLACCPLLGEAKTNGLLSLTAAVDTTIDAALLTSLTAARVQGALPPLLCVPPGPHVSPCAAVIPGGVDACAAIDVAPLESSAGDVSRLLMHATVRGGAPLFSLHNATAFGAQLTCELTRQGAAEGLPALGAGEVALEAQASYESTATVCGRLIAASLPLAPSSDRCDRQHALSCLIARPL